MSQQHQGGHDATTTLGNGVGFVCGFIYLNEANILLTPYFFDGFASLLGHSGNQALFYWIWMFFLFLAIFAVVKFAVFAVITVIKSVFALLLAVLFRRKEPR